MASQMAPAVLDTMSVDLENNGLTFRANGSKVKFPGFMKVYVEGKDDQLEEKDKMLPDLKEGIPFFQKILNQSSTSRSRLHVTLRQDLSKPLKS